MDGVPRGLAAHTKGLTCGDCRCARWLWLLIARGQQPEPPCGVAVRGGCRPWIGVGGRS